MRLLFPLLFALAIAVAQPLSNLQPVLGRIPESAQASRPVTLQTGLEGTEVLTLMRLAAQEAGYGFIHLKDTPNPKIRLSVEKRPFRQVWPTLVYGTLGPSFDFAAAGNILIVGPADQIAALVRRPLAAPTQPPAQAPVLEVLPTGKPTELLPLIKPLFDLEAYTLGGALVVRGLPEQIARAKTFVSQVEALAPKASDPTPPAVRYFPTRENGERYLEALRILSVETRVVPGGLIALGSEDALKRVGQLLGEIDARNAPPAPQGAPQTSLKIYTLGTGGGAQIAFDSLRRIYGDAISFSGDNGLVYAQLTEERHKAFEEDLQRVRTALSQTQTSTLPSVVGDTVLNYQLQQVPSVFAKVLQPLFPGATLLPMDESKTLVVKADPELHVQIAQAIKRLDRPTQADLDKEAQAKASAEQEQVTELYVARYVAAKELASAFNELRNANQGQAAQGQAAPSGNARAEAASKVQAATVARQNAVVLTGSKSEVARALKLLEALDQPPVQAQLRVAIYQLKTTDTFNLGFDWRLSDTPVSLNGGFGGGGLTVGTSIGLPVVGSLVTRLDTLAAQGQARKVLDSVIVATNGSPVELLSGGKLVVQTTASSSSGTTATSSTEYEYGLVARATPVILGDESVMVELDLQLGDLPSSGPIQNSILLNKSQTKTTLRIGSGQTAILGGTLGVEKQRTESGVPVLKDIPILGALFKSEQVSETSQSLVILVSPVVIPGNTVQKQNVTPSFTAPALPNWNGIQRFDLNGGK
ncbi:MAG: hypothetical protein KatS3mg071_1648 [Meiothermus sp.]|nr:MAG: hypothetical protein KatS3mg071_1648 [Meiothermus sp.]